VAVPRIGGVTATDPAAVAGVLDVDANRSGTWEASSSTARGPAATSWSPTAPTPSAVLGT
jgi:hypothetical protein